jgi:hypothetical protein
MKKEFWHLLTGRGDWKMYVSILAAGCLTAFFTQGNWIAIVGSGLWVWAWVYGCVSSWITRYIEEKVPPDADGRYMNLEQRYLFLVYYLICLFVLIPLFCVLQVYATFGDINFGVADAMRPFLQSMFACHFVILWLLFPAWDHFVDARKLVPEFQEKKAAPENAS